MTTNFILLLAESANDPTKEPEVLRAMLNAPLYAHVPASDGSSRLRFIQFIRRDNGKTVLPIFSERSKADESAADDVRVICMPGRDLLTITLGATLMLDPNHRDCVFYPEEMEALLRDGSAGMAINRTTESTTRVAVSSPRNIPAKMASALRSMYTKLGSVQRAYLTIVRMEHDFHHPSLFIVAIARVEERERVLRATVAAIQPHIEEPGLPIDIAVIAPDEETSNCLTKGARIYRKI
jgi:hypothetical protein